MNTPFELTGRTALVTGGSSGIGLAVATLLTELGARVVTADIAAAAISSIAADHVQGDIRDFGSVQKMTDGAMLNGKLDIVVNAAGIVNQLLPTIDQDIDRWQQVIDVNLRGTFLVAQAAARSMIKQGSGAIVNISSITGINGFPRRSAYGPSKAAVDMLTKSLACEWGQYGIRVNCVAPGYIRTPMTDGLFQDNFVNRSKLEARTPLGRLGNPEEIARTVAFLVSDWASYLTGATVPVDGGWSAFGGAGAVNEA